MANWRQPLYELMMTRSSDVFICHLASVGEYSKEPWHTAKSCRPFSEFRTMLLGWSSGCTNSAISHQHWPHYTCSLSIARSILRSHCWFTKPEMVNPQPTHPISQITCSHMIHPRSCARLTSNSFHSRPVVWNSMVTVRSAVQPQLYGTISLTVWRLPNVSFA